MGIWKRVALKLARQRNGLMTACGFGECNLQKLGAAQEALQVEYDELVDEFNELVDEYDYADWAYTRARAEAILFQIVSGVLLAALIGVLIANATH